MIISKSSRVESALLIVCCLLLTMCLVGCKSDEEESNAWHVSALWPSGSHPVPSTVSGDVLFMQEQAPAGFYLLRDGATTRLNPEGPDVRPDYAWSPDGSRFCFSSPGLPGEAETGIWIAMRDDPTTFTRLWDRGDHPRILPGNEYLICAGPAGGSEANIWQIPLAGGSPVMVASLAYAPEVSPDGFKISYLLYTGTPAGILVVLDRESGARDTLTGHVLNYSWLGDSQSLVFESNASGGQSVGYIYLEPGATAVDIGPGSRPAGFPTNHDFVFTGLESDRLAGLRLAAPGRPPVQISDIGTYAVPASDSRIVAQDSTRLIELTR